MGPYIKRWEHQGRRSLTYSPVPYNFGDDGRYLYVLNCGDQTVSVIDCSSNTVTSTITLTAGKDFASIHLRASHKQLLVMGNNWLDVIDIDQTSGTFNTVTTSTSWSVGSVAWYIATYLPPPFDFVTTGGSSIELPSSLDGGKIPGYISNDGRYSGSFRLGGHSNTYNIHLRHLSGELSANRIQYKLTRQNRTNTSVNYSLEGNLQNMVNYQDLNNIDFPVIKFGNFYVVFTGSSAYLCETDRSTSAINQILSTLGGTAYTYATYCPNAPDRLFVSYASAVNLITVLQIDFDNKVLVDLGDETKSNLGTNEAGTLQMIWNPYNGYLYAQGYRISNSTGVNKIHVLDPTAAVGSMEIATITVGEMMSASRATRVAQNMMTLNRYPCYEYPNVRI